ncbi:hypothetical protein ACVIHI_008174 [Bradyrhizobium sp. USDA 4524]
MVITDSSDRDQVRRRTRLTGLCVLEMASWSRLAGWLGDRSDGPWEGPCAARSAPTSDGATRTGGACGPAERSCARYSRLFLFASLTPQTVAFELEAVRIVNDAVQYRIAQGGIGNDVVPLRPGDLTCDQQGSLVVAIVDDLKQITALVGGERFGSPVVICGRPLMASTIWHFERLGRLRSYVRPLAWIISPRALMKSDNQGVTSRMRALELTRLVGVFLVFGGDRCLSSCLSCTYQA